MGEIAILELAKELIMLEDNDEESFELIVLLIKKLRQIG